MQLLDVDVQPVAIDRTVGLEVKKRCECVAANSLLVDRAFNSVNGVLVGLIPQTRKLVIILSLAIRSIARDSGSLGSMRNCALSR